MNHRTLSNDLKLFDEKTELKAYLNYKIDLYEYLFPLVTVLLSNFSMCRILRKSRLLNLNPSFFSLIPENVRKMLVVRHDDRNTKIEFHKKHRLQNNYALLVLCQTIIPFEIKIKALFFMST